jgi:hypothetical protein
VTRTKNEESSQGKYFAKPEGKTSDWKTKDDMSGWRGSRRRKNKRKELVETR